jgi:hypothetical protein
MCLATRWEREGPFDRDGAKSAKEDAKIGRDERVGGRLKAVCSHLIAAGGSPHFGRRARAGFRPRLSDEVEQQIVNSPLCLSFALFAPSRSYAHGRIMETEAELVVASEVSA